MHPRARRRTVRWSIARRFQKLDLQLQTLADELRSRSKPEAVAP